MESDDAELGPGDTGGGEQTGADSGGAGEPNDALAVAVRRYRELVASIPGLVPEMVRGQTIEEIDASAELARRSYGEITRRIAEQYERDIPTGNPARSSSTAAYDNLKPEAKIALGLKRKG
ncbi:MAG: hypothetical protein M3437_00100 [Chloroflexota bacterium]|nr:hypothetical protein [Chloroflexota bacterium]MDQ5864969.1 hypothetical protein [Chloroflexota bacterium]